MNQRREFLEYFFRAASPYRYAVLKFIHGSLDKLPENSDVDIAIDREDLDALIYVIRKDKNVDRLHLHKKSYVTYVSILFRDESYLELDLIHRFDRKGLIFLDIKDVTDEAVCTANGIKIASNKHNFEYTILFYLLNYAPVPDRYREYFGKLDSHVRSEIFTHMTGKYKVNLNVLDELYEARSRFAKKIRESISRYPVNTGLSRLRNKIRCFGDTVRDALFHRGIIITFSGVDGAGKSTVLDAVNEELKCKYRQRTVVLRHRPSLLPILSSYKYGKENAEKLTRENLPRQGKNRNFISSLLRFFYYYADYFFGQFYIFFRYSMRGYIVLYDRYYFDFIIDARRSNIQLPASFTRWWYRFIMKPEVNVFLYAPPEEIRRRKQELESEDIRELTEGYLDLFKGLSRPGRREQYLMINNTDLQETLRLVTKNCISALI